MTSISTPSGAKIRFDQFPCNGELANGNLCNSKQITYVQFIGWDRKIHRHKFHTCRHFIEEKYGPEFSSIWSNEIMIDFVDLVQRHALLQSSISHKYITITDELKNRHPSVNFWIKKIPEKRPGKGQWKEIRGVVKKRYEWIVSQPICGDVFSESVDKYLAAGFRNDSRP